MACITNDIAASIICNRGRYEPLQHCNVNVEYVHSDEEVDSITDSPEYRRLQSLYMDLRREMFVNRILLNKASW